MLQMLKSVSCATWSFGRRAANGGFPPFPAIAGFSASLMIRVVPLFTARAVAAPAP